MTHVPIRHFVEACTLQDVCERLLAHKQVEAVANGVLELREIHGAQRERACVALSIVVTAIHGAAPPDTMQYAKQMTDLMAQHHHATT